jgi:tetratricopeptide (TPR) repeat protein
MDLTDVLEAVGTLSTAAAVGITWWRARVGDREEFRRRRAAPGVAPGMTVAPPVGALPTLVRGRGRLMRLLRRWLRRPPGVVVVLAGMGGVGKSTVAAALARHSARTRRIGRRSRPVWWVWAADSLSLAGGLASVARQLGAEPADLEAISTGAADGPDRFWELLDSAPSGWLLIFDNADSPDILRGTRSDAGRAGARPMGTVGQNGTGWVRPSRRGLTIVTSRDADQETWGAHARLVPLGPLDETDAARALLDLAPEAGDEAAARLLARRLGGLPLALHLAGSYLRSTVVYCPTFTAYAEVLGGDGGLRLLDGSGAPDRSVVTRTWEISLDNLARDGVPQARNLLRLLSCYAADASIPMSLLDGRRLFPLLAREPTGSSVDHSDLLLERGLRALARVGLIDVGTSGRERALTLHPLIVQTNRMNLMNLGTTTSRITEPDATLVRQVAAGLVVDALSGLRVDEPADWPRYRMVGVHLHALLGTVADHLDEDGLTALLRATWMTVCALDESGAHDVAERLNRAALAHVPHQDHEVGLCLSHQLAWELALRGWYTDSERIFLEVTQRRARLLGDDHPETLKSRHELAWVAGCQQRWVEAEARYDLVLEDRRHVLGEDHFDTLLTRFERGWSIANQGRFDEARALLELVLQDRIRLLGEAHQRTVGTRHELAWIAAKQGRLGEAESLYRQVLVDRRRALGDEHLSTLTIHHELAWVLACRGRSKEAATRYARVLDIRRRRLGEDHPDTRATALALDRLGRGLTVDARHLV